MSTSNDLKQWNVVFLFFLVGTILMPGSCVSSLSGLEVQYEGYASKLGILMYYIAVSNHTDVNSQNCKPYVSINIYRQKIHLQNHLK